MATVTEIWEQKQCPLFALPAEIRFTIYGYVFSLPSSNDVPISPLPPAEALPLLRTCNRIMEEAEREFYGAHCLQLTYGDMRSLYRAIPKRCHGLVTRLRVTVPSVIGAMFTLMSMTDFPQLKSLEIRRYWDMTSTQTGLWTRFTCGFLEVCERLDGLVELKIVTLGVPTKLSKGEEERLKRFNEFDSTCVNFVKRRHDERVAVANALASALEEVKISDLRGRC